MTHHAAVVARANAAYVANFILPYALSFVSRIPKVSGCLRKPPDHCIILYKDDISMQVKKIILNNK